MTKENCKAEINLGDRIITVEGPRDFVESMVAQYSSSKLEAKLSNNKYTESGTINAGAGSEKDLVAAKRPRGHHEIVAVLAFWLSEHGTPEFTEDDLRRAYIRAGVRPPKVIAQALRDAKNKFDYLQLAGERGRYRLTDHGDRVVRFDLPASGGSHAE